MIKFGVTITASNGNKQVEHYIESDSLLGCARIISTFQPNKGYKAVKVKIDEVQALDLEMEEYINTELLNLEKSRILETSKG